MTQPDVFRAAVVNALGLRAGLSDWTIDYWRPPAAVASRHIWCEAVVTDLEPLTAQVGYTRTYTLVFVVQAMSTAASDTSQSIEAEVVDAVDEIVDLLRESPRLSGADHAWVARVTQLVPELDDHRPGAQARVDIRYRSDT